MVRSENDCAVEAQQQLQTTDPSSRQREVGVRWPLACEDVSPGAEERPFLKPLPSSAVKTVTENTSLCV
jgi:hypothetical protein